MTENKINPLLDVMSEIDDGIITNTASTAKKGKKRPIIIAAVAAAMLSVAIPVTVGALTRAPIEMIVNNELTEPGYDVYTDEYGHTVETYVYDIPAYALREEREGMTAVGKVRAVYDPEIVGTGWGINGYRLVDENGNKFTCVNNKIVEVYIDRDYTSTYGFSCPNLADGYTTYEEESKHFHGDVEVDRCLYVVKEDELDDILRLHGLDFLIGNDD